MGAQPDQMIMFSTAVVNLFGKGLKDIETPAFHAELKKLGIDLDKPLPGYPFDLWERALELTAPLFPGLSPEALHEELGKRTVDGSMANPILKAVLTAVGVIGVTRALKRITSRSGAHSTNVITFGEETKNSLVLSSTHAGTMPHYGVGSYKALVGLLGGKNPRAEVLSFNAPKATWLVEWD